MNKIYCGSAKEKTFNDGGSILNVSLNLDDIENAFGEYGFTTQAGKRIIKVKIGKRRSEGAYGETHTVEVDTWKPNQQQSTSYNQGQGDSGQYQQKQNNVDYPPKQNQTTQYTVETKNGFTEEIPF